MGNTTFSMHKQEIPSQWQCRMGRHLAVLGRCWAPGDAEFPVQFIEARAAGGLGTSSASLAVLADVAEQAVLQPGSGRLSLCLFQPPTGWSMQNQPKTGSLRGTSESLSLSCYNTQLPGGKTANPHRFLAHSTVAADDGPTTAAAVAGAARGPAAVPIPVPHVCGWLWAIASQAVSAAGLPAPVLPSVCLEPGPSPARSRMPRCPVLHDRAALGPVMLFFPACLFSPPLYSRGWSLFNTPSRCLEGSSALCPHLISAGGAASDRRLNFQGIPAHERSHPSLVCVFEIEILPPCMIKSFISD